jgi:transcriptional regulator with XRE-family HTH domain
VVEADLRSLVVSGQATATDCGAWLGSVETAANRCDGAPETTQEQIMTSRKVGGLLELLPRLNPDLATHSLRQTLNTYISSAAHGNAQALANHVGSSSLTVRDWVNGLSTPLLSGLLRMSRALNVPLSSFYEADGLRQPIWQRLKRLSRRLANEFQSPTIGLRRSKTLCWLPSIPIHLADLGMSREGLDIRDPSLCIGWIRL